MNVETNVESLSTAPVLTDAAMAEANRIADELLNGAEEGKVFVQTEELVN